MNASALDRVRVLADRELRARLAEKSFLVSMVVSLLAIVAFAVLPKLLAGSPSTWEIGAAGADAVTVARASAQHAPAEREATAVELDSEAAARRAVADGTVDVAVYPDGRLLADSELEDELETILRQAISADQLAARLTAAGVAPEEVAELAAPVPTELDLLDAPDEAHDRRLGFAAVGVTLLFTQLLGYCYWVASGVVEEKSSRVIEVLLAKVRPRELLAAKVAGIGALGLGQLIAFVVVGLVSFTLADRFPIPPGVWPLAGVVLLAFVAGYVLYASLFSIAGAMAARAEELQATSTPFSMLLSGSFFAAIATMSNPGGGAAQVLSMIPFSAPLLMPIRIADGSVQPWEVALSGLLVVATAIILVVVAERLYRGGVLRTERQTSFRELLRLAR